MKSHAPKIAQLEEELTLMFNCFASFRDKQKSDGVTINKLEAELDLLRGNKQQVQAEKEALAQEWAKQVAVGEKKI